MSEETKEEREQREKKEVAYYQVGLTAWYNTALERDKSLLTLSTAGIGLLITLAKTQGISSAEALILHIVAILSFLICLICVLVIFKENKKHIEKVIKGIDTDNTLGILDNTAIISFSIGVLFSVVISISSSINSYSIKKEKTMANENTENSSSNSIFDSVQGVQNLKTDSTGLEKLSVDGIQYLKPQAKPSVPPPPSKKE